MKICELVLKNFGKFSGKKISLPEGVQILYGENESGKSTIHTFIRGMLFGIERGRGRAAKGDVFSIYEPWENSNYYSGRLIFETGGKHFIIDRNFDRYNKKAGLVCREDGEELSVEGGDLEQILGGLTPSGYDNTVSVAQLKAQPGQSLAAELKNYASNYYAAGDSDLHPVQAVKALEEKKKEAEKAIKKALEKKREKRERLEQELSYIWRDIHRVTEEQEHLEEEIDWRKEKEEQKESEEKQRIFDELRPSKWRIHPVEVIVMTVALVLSFLLIPRPFNSFVTIVLFLCGLIYIWNRMKIGKKQVKTEPELILEEIMPEEEKIPLEKLVWEYERNAEELRDKQVQYDNLRETLEELQESSEDYKKYDMQKAAAQLAITRIEELSRALRGRLKAALNERASEIIEEITAGKYNRLILEEELSLSLLADGRKIPVEQVSRGTIEQIYFALRMAVAELLYSEDYPVILDDTFAYYDDKRLGRTLEWLYKNKKQVLIFTCQKREEEILAGLGIPYQKESI